MSENPTINLIDYRSRPLFQFDHIINGYFRIESMKNTTDYNAGSWLKKEEVQEIINKGWMVNIRHPKKSDMEYIHI